MIEQIPMSSSTNGTASDPFAPKKRRLETHKRSRLLPKYPLPKTRPFLITLAVMALIILGSISNILKYSNNGQGIEVPLAVATALAMGVVAMSWPRGLSDITWPMALFMTCAVLGLSKPVLSGTTADALQASATVLAASCSMFIGGCLGQNITPKASRFIQIAGAVGYVALAASIIGSVHATKNTISGTMFEIVALMLFVEYTRTGSISWKKNIVAGIAIIFAAVIADHRVMLLIAVFFTFGLIFLSVYRHRWLRIAGPAAAAIGGLGIIIALTQFTHSSPMMAIDDVVRQETGRTLFSGRETFWGTLVYAITSGPITGYGPAAVAYDFTGLNWSTHNAFLQIGIAYGYIGLLFVLILIGMLIRRSYRAPINSAGILLSVYLASVLLHNSSENLLFQINFVIAQMTWINIGFLAVRCAIPARGERARIGLL